MDVLCTSFTGAQLYDHNNVLLHFPVKSPNDVAYGIEWEQRHSFTHSKCSARWGWLVNNPGNHFKES
jgi:hypothetical protein